MPEFFSVAILDDYQGVALDLADWAGFDGVETVSFERHIGAEDELVAALSGFDAVVLMRERTPFPASVINRLPGLRLIITTGSKNASIDVASARQRGIVVCGTGALVTPTAELTWGLLLSLFRNIPAEDANVRQGRWQRTIGRSLAGSTIGIVGLGRIGATIAGYAQAFGMKTIAWSQNLTEERAAAISVRAVSKEELFETADVVTLHLRASPRTANIVEKHELDLMKPSAFLINTSRPSLIDQAALVDALANRRIAGAGIDVFDDEPVTGDHPLFALDNTVLTPHLGYVTDRNYEIFFNDALECVKAFLTGKPVRIVED